MRSMIFHTIAAVSMAATLSGASAENIDFSATITNACTISLGTAGQLALSTDGTVLGSEELTGVPATVTILSLGANTLTIDAPVWQAKPGDYSTSGETLEVAYTGAGGLSAINEAYRSTQATHNLDLVPAAVLTLNSRARNANGFPAGSYTLRVVVTCS